MKSAFISVAPPTPNGNLHLGHLSGPYVASDIYRRYVALRGTSVVLVSGSDDNQSYVPVKGHKMRMAPEAVAAEFGDAVYSTLQNVGARFDYFLRPIKNAEYATFVQDFFRKLVDSGHVQAREVDSFYCDHCRRHLFEAYLGGNCPHCDAETNAQGCEDCGLYNDGIDLLKPECNQCLKIPSVRRTKKFYFSLEPHHDSLDAFLARADMSPFLREFTRRLLSHPLPEVSASFISDWGIPVPMAGYEDQVIYEWLEMAAGYLFMAQKLESRIGGHAFDERSEVEIIQFFGFDNSFFYTTFIPALLLAHDPNTRLPSAFLSNRYFKLAGLKFSTSTGHAIWGDELLEIIPSDVIRFCLMYDRPENEHTSFTIAACRALVESQLVGQWDAWLGSLSHRTLHEGVLNDPSPGVFIESLHLLREEMETHYGSTRFSPREATRTLCRLVRLAKDANSIALELMAAKLLAVIASPILPNFSESLWRALGEESELAWDAEISVPKGPFGPLVWDGFSRAAVALEKFEEEYGKRGRVTPR